MIVDIRKWDEMIIMMAPLQFLTLTPSHPDHGMLGIQLNLVADSDGSIYSGIKNDEAETILSLNVSYHIIARKYLPWQPKRTLIICQPMTSLCCLVHGGECIGIRPKNRVFASF